MPKRNILELKLSSLSAACREHVAGRRAEQRGPAQLGLQGRMLAEACLEDVAGRDEAPYRVQHLVLGRLAQRQRHQRAPLPAAIPLSLRHLTLGKSMRPPDAFKASHISMAEVVKDRAPTFVAGTRVHIT